MRNTIASLALLLGSLLAVGACQNDPDLHARVGELAEMPGVVVKIEGADLDHAQMQAIARHLEGKTVDTGAAMMQMKKDDKGATSFEVQLYAKSLPSGDALTADLKSTFPALAGATISTAPATNIAPDLPVVQVSDDLSPEEARQEVLEQLQAQGVEGNVDVQIHDAADGRRIEVKLDKHVAH